MRGKKLFLLVFALGMALPTLADDGSLPPVTGFLGKLGALLDSMAVKGLDRRYIDVPEKPWQVIHQTIDAIAERIDIAC